MIRNGGESTAMSNNSKRIAIARAIMYKELEKRKDARVIECKRRGLWTLWQYQTRYKTLWHFLRASDTRLIMLCDECMSDLRDKCSDCVKEISYLEDRHHKNPCEQNRAGISHYYKLYFSREHAYNEISTIRNNLYGGSNDENQN